VRWPPDLELVNWSKSAVVGYSPDSNDVNTEAIKSPLLRSVIRERPVVKAD
jgi:hypothetical protein